MARVALPRRPVGGAGKIVVPFLPSPPLPLPLRYFPLPSPPSPTSATDGKKVLDHFGRSVVFRQTRNHAHSRYALAPPLVLERAGGRGRAAGKDPFSLMGHTIGEAGAVPYCAGVRSSVPSHVRLCENSYIVHSAGSLGLHHHLPHACARTYVLSSHSPRIRYIYRAAKTSKKLPNTFANNEPEPVCSVLYDYECFSSSPRQILLFDARRGTE